MKKKKSDRYSHHDSVMSQLPTRVMKVQFILDKRLYTLDLQKLWVQGLELQDIPLNELDAKLQDVSIYRATLVAALEDMNERLQAIERKFIHWNAVQLANAYTEILKDYERTTGKTPSLSKMVGISRQQAQDWIMAQRKYYLQHTKYHKAMRKYRRLIGVTEGVIKTLDNWNMALMSIARRRSPEGGR